MKKDDLPKIIPVFPLSNFIIFPNTTVPLNIFEPRYVKMINDSIKTNKMIGLIQPKKKNLIKTVSVNQSRKPIYKDSVNTSNNYKDFLNLFHDLN